jgi:peptidoglycan hydrolase CwlO-like protein
MDMMPPVTMIALAALILSLVVVFAKIIRSNTNLTSAVEQLRADYTSNLESVQRQFDQIHGSNTEIDKKLDSIKESTKQIEIEMKGVTTEMRIRNENKT